MMSIRPRGQDIVDFFSLILISLPECNTLYIRRLKLPLKPFLHIEEYKGGKIIYDLLAGIRIMRIFALVKTERDVAQSG